MGGIGISQAGQERRQLQHPRLVTGRVTLRTFGAQGHRLEVARVLSQHLSGHLAQEARRHQCIQLRTHVVQVGARPAHQFGFQRDAHLGHQSKNRLRLLQAPHRLAEQILLDGVTTQRECVGIAHRQQVVRGQCRESTVHQVGAQAVA